MYGGLAGGDEEGVGKRGDLGKFSGMFLNDWLLRVMVAGGGVVVVVVVEEGPEIVTEESHRYRLQEGPVLMAAKEVKIVCGGKMLVEKVVEGV